MPQTALQIRPAKPSDCDRLIPLVNAAFQIAEPFMTGPRTDPERLAEVMVKGEILLAEDNAAQLAASVYTEVRSERGYIGMLAVHPARQGTRLGRFMMETAEQHLRNKRCTAVDITVLSLRPELPPFYRKLGYTETGTEEFHYPHAIKDGLECHCVVMSKAL